MASIIFAALFLIIGIAVGAFLLSKGHTGAGIGSIIAGILLCVILIICGCVVTVPTGHTGVLTTFGAVEDRVLDSGINTKAP